MKVRNYTNISIWPVLQVFWQHARRYKLAVFIALFSIFLVYLIAIFIPLIYKQLFDTLVAEGKSPNAYNQLLRIIITIGAFHVATWVVLRINQSILYNFQPRIMADLIQSAFAYLELHSYKFFADNFSGSLVRKVNRISRAYDFISDQILYTYIPLVVTVTGIIVVLFSRHWMLGSVFIVWTIVFMVVQYAIAQWKQKYNIALAKKDSEATGVLSDSITNITTVKSFASEAYERTIFRKVIDELRALRFVTMRIDERINLVQNLFYIVVEIGLIYITLRLWFQGIATVGDFALVQAYLIYAFDRLWNFGRDLRRSYEAVADAHEMVEILNTPHEVQDRPQATKLVVREGVITFKDVTFNFHETRSVLKNFTLSIHKGEKVALVGPSGAGKTTVTKLLFRFYDVTAGELLIDGQNIAHCTQESLRSAVSLVPQEPILFHRTLLENIRYGKRGASKKEVVEAAKQSHCHEFINKLPDGYNTYVGERGIKLSSGERQRVAIARAILKNAPILVLDEATSSLDSESEALIQDALAALMKDKTVIVIAHRLSTIMKMDRIIVMEEGDITAMGTHQELLEKGGVYKKLWEIQAGGFMQ